MKRFPVIIKNLNWYFGKEQILDRVNIQVQEGKFYSIIGPNGSGKTTLLKNINRLLYTPQDAVFLDKEDLTRLSHRKIAKKMAIVPQNTEIDFSFEAMDIVMMGRTPYLGRFEEEGKEDFKIVKEAMEMTNTWSLRHQNIDTLSGGERQRVIVARAIAQQTPILLLDEPISHLDLQYQHELMKVVRGLNQQKKTTVIAVLHDLNIAAQYSDILILLHEGSIVMMDEPAKVLTKQNIREVYGIDVHIIEHPSTKKPHIIPIG
ncbi:MAG: ABC transporter ATP-binding protein [Epulopiscium sp.]|nr:ABC transporter ATP-binding protein [Candidatus Epulonipiscium sp.]